MKTAGFTGGLAGVGAAAGGAEGAAEVSAGAAGPGLSPLAPGRAGVKHTAIVLAPASIPSAAGASSASDSAEDSDSSSASWRWRFRAPLRLLIFSRPWAETLSDFLPGEPEIRHEGSRRDLRPLWTADTPQRPGLKGRTLSHPRASALAVPAPSLPSLKCHLRDCP